MLNTIEELRSNKTAAQRLWVSQFICFFSLIYSRILIKMGSPILSQMNCGLFYAIPIINVVILTDHLFYNVCKKNNQFSDVYSLF